MIQKRSLAALSFVVGALASPAGALACSVCIGAASGNDPVADAYNWSILFLMATPYTVIGSVGGWLFFRYRRASTKDEGVSPRPAWSRKEVEAR